MNCHQVDVVLLSDKMKSNSDHKEYFCINVCMEVKSEMALLILNSFPPVTCKFKPNFELHPIYSTAIISEFFCIKYNVFYKYCKTKQIND